ncbi:MAG: site-specific DNA-methyltransferase, partial [Chitinophagia bacterium]|nr:site-specific DNA-methyltransferase [Chitinophagia bacterium]
MDTNIIYLEDCLTGMERLPNGAIDLILCDPPYGITDNKWDKVLNPNRLWEQYLRVIKENGAIVLTAQQPFATDLINKARKYFRYELIWVKSMSGGFLNANRMPLRKHENILVFYKKLPTYNPQKTGEKRDVVIVKPQKGNRCTNYQPTKDYLRHDDGTRHPSSVLHFPNGNRGSLHPTQKPVELF